jgi:hypothetical protein
MTETGAAAMITGGTFKETRLMVETGHTIDIENTVVVAAAVTIINPTVMEGLIVVNTIMIDQDIDPSYS